MKKRKKKWNEREKKKKRNVREKRREKGGKRQNGRETKKKKKEQKKKDKEKGNKQKTKQTKHMCLHRFLSTWYLFICFVCLLLNWKAWNGLIAIQLTIKPHLCHFWFDQQSNNRYKKISSGNKLSLIFSKLRLWSALPSPSWVLSLFFFFHGLFSSTKKSKKRQRGKERFRRPDRRVREGKGNEKG